MNATFSKIPMDHDLPSVKSFKPLEIHQISDKENTNVAIQENDITCSSVRAFVLDWSCTVLIGTLVVSFWRGTWLLLDVYLCQQSIHASLLNGETFCVLQSDSRKFQSAWISYLAGTVLLYLGLVVHSRGIWYFSTVQRLTWKKSIQRMCLVYVFGIGSVFIWRGIWYASDEFFWPNSLSVSYAVTMLLGFCGCFGIGCGASLLAPPSLFFMDGPGHLPPPIGLTISEAYYTVTLPKDSRMPPQILPLRLLDVLMSFVVLPIFVVWFWRGCWGLLDCFLWGFTQQRDDLNMSLLWGTILASCGLFMGSNDALYLLPKMNHNIGLSRVVGRLKTITLAISTVSFWRVVWYVWDEYLGKSRVWSGWLSHIVGVVGLSTLGCLSCISASPTTVGVDALTNEDAVEEPLFHSVPVPAESIHLMAICRKPASRIHGHGHGHGHGLECMPSRRFNSVVCSSNPTIPTVSRDELCVSRRSMVKREYSIQFIRSR